MNKVSKIACLLLLLSWQCHSDESIWTLNNVEQVNSSKDKNRVNANREFIAALDLQRLTDYLYQQRDNVVIDVPLPSGEMVKYRLESNTALEQGLIDQYPNLKTYNGYQVDNLKNTGKFELTSAGLHGMFSYRGKLVFLDPKYLGNDRIYSSYYKSDAVNNQQQMVLNTPINKAIANFLQARELENTVTPANTVVALKTYRLAITTTGEYTQFHGGVDNVMTELATLVNRINFIYEHEFAARLSLVANNRTLVFPDPATDPFKNELGDDISDATQVISQRIGTANYDIGHLLATDGGGLAALGVACDNEAKATGGSGISAPVGNAFHVDLVAHEIGHQFGATHTFNGLSDACGENRNDESSYEVGSGSTIMSYAGICGDDNLQSNADPFFHGHSIDQVKQHLARFPSCGTPDTGTNRTPVASAGSDYIIPANTPFTLTGTGTDQDNDSLTYDWQQFDLGAGNNGRAGQVDDGKRPLFRAFAPKQTSSRTFPQLKDVLSGNLTFGETYATTNRALNFRLIVRDMKGGVASDNSVVTVVNTGEAFAVTEPSSATNWTGQEQTIRWNVAKTNEAPIACQNVAIDLSIDGGQSFGVNLTSSTANTGSFNATIPTLNTSSARLRVSCVNNVFFAINTGNFSINSQGVTFEITGVSSPLLVNEDESLSLSAANFTIQGRVANSITVAAGDNYTVNNNQVTPSANFNGQLQVNVTANAGAEQTPTFVAQVTVNPVNDAPVANNDTLTINQDAGQQTIDVVGNDADIDANDTLTLSTINYSGTGQASIVNNQISYTPASGFNGTETINYTISDSANSNASATLTITVNAPAPAPAPTPNPTPTPAPPADSGSGGGAVFWLALLAMFGLRYAKRKY